MWDEAIKFLFTQGILGIAVACLSTALVLIYKENKKERQENKVERKESTDKFIKIATDSVQFIKESTMTLQNLREEMKVHNDEAREHREQSRLGMEKLLLLLDVELKNRKG